MAAAGAGPSAVAVAVSGGRDSTALLHCTARMARGLALQVHALHVHHGLTDEADAWLAQVQRQCRRWARAGLPLHFHAVRLSSRPAAGDSVEAWARRERYRALAGMAREAGCPVVLLAHHRRDQAETLLLQALRGGGPAGLAAMPAAARRDGITWLRPWLQQPREAVEAYLRRHRLRAVDDASNADPRLARSALRTAVWPALLAAFPDAETQLAAAARRAAEAADCLHDQASADVAFCADMAGLRVADWARLGPARRRQALREWLRGVARGAPESLVQRLAEELPAARGGSWPAPDGGLALYRGRLARAAPAPAPWPAAGGPAARFDLRRAGLHPLPGWGGSLQVERVRQGGIPAARLAAVQARERRGGERFQRAPRSLPRSLKKQFQAAAVPAAQRHGPLLFDGDALLYVPGLGIDARCLAAEGEPQFSLSWRPAG